MDRGRDSKGQGKRQGKGHKRTWQENMDRDIDNFNGQLTKKIRVLKAFGLKKFKKIKF
jgi:hypothetical protein